MSYLSRNHLKNLTTYLKEYYDESNAKAALEELIQYYDNEAFDDEDVTNDWIPNDCKNSHGIDKFVESLNYEKLYDPANKKNLFEWFCHWLLEDVPEPNIQPVHEPHNNTTRGDSPFNVEMSDPIADVAHELALQLTSEINQFAQNPQNAANMAEAFIKICKEDDYTELLELNSDFENIEDSFIVDELIKKYPQYRYLKEKIFDMFQYIVTLLLYDNYPPFEISNFECKFSEETFRRANKLCMHFIPSFFKNKVVFSDTDTHKSRKNVKEDDKDVELLNAKALDFQNNFPLLINLFDAYTRFRTEDNRMFWRTASMTPTSDKQMTPTPHRSMVLDASEWWEKYCGFAKFLKQQNEFIYLSFKHALPAVNKRALPKLNFNHIVDMTIFDSYDIFARYVCAFNDFLHFFLKKNGSNGTVPFQVDLWILPRLTEAGVHHKHQVPAGLYSSTLPLSDDDDHDDDDKTDDVNKIMGDLCSGKIQELGKNESIKGAQGKIWDIEDHLKGDGYKKGEDYWLLCETADNYKHQKLKRNFRNLWKLYSDNDLSKKNDVSYKRFILIIDRRNPTHLRNKRMVKDTKEAQTWNDRMYLIRPKKYTLEVKNKSSINRKVYRDEICKLYRNLMNETFIGNTMDYLFPMPQLKKGNEYRNDFGGLDSGNGYKFVVSYHVHFYNKVKMYWYYGQGAMRFFMNDIHWLWPRYFNPKDDKDTPESFQKLSRDGKFQMERAVNEYALEDKQFNQFNEKLGAFNVNPN